MMLMIECGGGLASMGMATPDSLLPAKRPHALTDKRLFREKVESKEWFVSDKVDGEYARLFVFGGLAVVAQLSERRTGGPSTFVPKLALSTVGSSWPVNAPAKGSTRSACGVFDGELVERDSNKYQFVIVFDMISSGLRTTSQQQIDGTTWFKTRLGCIERFFDMDGLLLKRDGRPPEVPEICFGVSSLTHTMKASGRGGASAFSAPLSSGSASSTHVIQLDSTSRRRPLTLLTARIAF